MRALINEPELLILDEPTTGLDPQARQLIWQRLRLLRRLGLTLVLTTHYMEEAHRLCNEIAIVDRGKIITRGHPDRLLRDQFPAAIVRLPSAALASDAPLPKGAARRDGEIQVLTDDVPAAINALETAGAVLADLQVSSPTLEDLFLKLTGHALRG